MPGEITNMPEALAYVASTGYVPWSTPVERDLTEKMQRHNLIIYVPRQFEPYAAAINGTTRRRTRLIRGYYRLTLEGRARAKQFQ